MSPDATCRAAPVEKLGMVRGALVAAPRTGTGAGAGAGAGAGEAKESVWRSGIRSSRVGVGRERCIVFVIDDLVSFARDAFEGKLDVEGFDLVEEKVVCETKLGPGERKTGIYR